MQIGSKYLFVKDLCLGYIIYKNSVTTSEILVFGTLAPVIRKNNRTKSINSYLCK